jgi:cytochrome c oxidase cbb3-type subunit I/II
MEQQVFSYDNKIVKQFMYATLVWGVVGMVAGLFIAVQMYFPDLSFKLPYTTFGRVRPVHTNAAIFAFVGNAIFMGYYYSIQRVLKTRMFSDVLSKIHFWGWQSIIVAAAVTLLMGFTTSKEYAELEWPIDIMIAVVWVVFGWNMFGTILKRRIKHIYVAVWFYIATFITVAVLHIVNSIELPASFLKSYPVYAGVQDALVQWWYGHNAVAFFLTTPFLGLMYYFLPKASNRPVYSYRLSIVHFWSLIFIYIWAGPHHLLYQSLPDWAQSLGVIFSVMLIAPSWGGMINGLVTLRGAWDKVRDSAMLKFMVVAVTAYGLSTFEGPMLSLKTVNAISHFTDWTVGHAHIGALGWNGFLTFGILYWLVPKMFRTKLHSQKLANLHFWVGTLGILFYAIPLYWAAFTQWGMWREFNEFGKLANPLFLDTVTKLIPMYIWRSVGGALYIAGVVIMIVNLSKTMKAGSFIVNEEDSAPALVKPGKKRLAGETGHSWLERMPTQFAIITFLAIIVGGLVQIIPMITVKSNIPTIESVTPYTPLELQGRDLYIREGCNNCHSQMVRPFRHETERYGEYSKAGEFVYDHPFLWGSKRTGPDLARSGVYTSSVYKSANWHYNHFKNPQSIDSLSLMPAYPWFLTNDLNNKSLPKKIRVMQKLGVPYPEGYDAIALDDLKKQAEEIAQELRDAGIKDADPNKEIIAMIAYLHRLGKDITLMEEKSEEEVEMVKMPSAPMMDEANLTAGADIYKTNCLACHGVAGEGNAVGPNLTDDYWIHGGSNDDIYHIIHEGYLQKGMQAWKDILSEEQMLQVTSYLISIIGSEPANAKEPQGELFERNPVEAVEAEADTNKVETAENDSL